MNDGADGAQVHPKYQKCILSKSNAKIHPHQKVRRYAIMVWMHLIRCTASTSAFSPFPCLPLFHFPSS